MIFKMNSGEVAGWIRDRKVMAAFLAKMRSTVDFKAHTYEVVMDWVPISFGAEEPAAWKRVEQLNGLRESAIQKAVDRWDLVKSCCLSGSARAISTCKWCDLSITCLSNLIQISLFHPAPPILETSSSTLLLCRWSLCFNFFLLHCQFCPLSWCESPQPSCMVLSIQWLPV